MLTKWFSGKDDAHRIGIFTLPGAQTAYFATPEEATTYALSISDKEVYFQVGMGATDPGLGHRWSTDDIVSLPGLWADIDYACAGQTNKKRLAPDRATADQILASLPWKPTFLVHSGHGLQAFWKFKEPWDLTKEHARAVEIAAKWNTYIQAMAGNLGYTVDSVGDLARVMRVPGTTNHKSTPVPVVLEAETDSFIDLESLESILADVQFSAKKASYRVGDIIIDGNAEPPGEKLAALLVNDPKFAETWEHRRTDMHDYSASAYDLSMANILADAGWSDQEIVNTIISRRKKWGAEPKNRETYLVTTMQAAVERREKEKAVKHAGEALTSVLQSGATIEEKREKAMAHLSKVFDVRISRIVCYMGDPREYRLETEMGCVRLGGIEGVRSWQKFYDAMLNITRKRIPRFKTKAWDIVIDALMAIMEDQEVGTEGTDRGMAESWINDYLTSKSVCEDEKSAKELMLPYKSFGKVRIFSNDFMRWINLNHGRNFTPRAVGMLLRIAGCHPGKVNDGKTSRSVWEMP